MPENSLSILFPLVPRCSRRDPNFWLKWQTTAAGPCRQLAHLSHRTAIQKFRITIQVLHASVKVNIKPRTNQRKLSCHISMVIWIHKSISQRVRAQSVVSSKQKKAAVHCRKMDIIFQQFLSFSFSSFLRSLFLIRIIFVRNGLVFYLFYFSVWTLKN